VVDADGSILGKYRKNHIPHVEKFWEKFYFRPGNLGYPVFETAVGKVGTYICYDRHFPEGWRELGLNGAHMVFNPNATKPGLSNRLWEVEGPCAAVANGYFVLQPNRVGLEDNEYDAEAVNFYGTSQVIDPRGNFVGELGSKEKEELLVRDLDMDMVREMRDDWQFYRDRRPDSYTRIAQP
jgi:beta-ureidopropionase